MLSVHCSLQTDRLCNDKRLRMKTWAGFVLALRSQALLERLSADGGKLSQASCGPAPGVEETLF